MKQTEQKLLDKLLADERLVDMMKIYYMRDDHTFLALPLHVGKAESLLRNEFDKGYTGGMLCSKSAGMETPLQANGKNKEEKFFCDARAWLQRAVDLSA